MSNQPTKRPRTFNDRNYRNKKVLLEVGLKGFLATCNFREKECVRECYNILNQYADEIYDQGDKKTDEDVLESDITDDLQKAIDETKEKNKKNGKHRFQVVDTGTSNCIFIKTSLDPVELGTKIIKDIAEKKQQKTRFLLRLVPILIVCKANLAEIVKCGGELFDKYFLKEAHTYCIVFNRRYNNSVKREEVIRELAEIVGQKNIQNKVDLENPELTIIVEIIKGFCCLSVVEGYLKYKKYNLFELANVQKEQVSKEIVEAGLKSEQEIEQCQESKNAEDE